MRPSRVLLWSILVTAAFYVGSFVALGNSFPTVESGGEEIVRWFTDNPLKARTYAWTAAFVTLGFAAWGALVASVMPRPHGYLVLAGVIGWGITGQVQGWIWAGLALHPESLAPQTAKVIFDISQYWGPLVNGSTTTMSAGFVALGLVASPVLPRWLFWLSLAFFLEQAIETITVFGETGFLAPGGTMNVYLGGVIGFAWVGGVTNWAMHRLDEGPTD